MNYFVKISIEGSFPSGVDELGTYEVSEAMHEHITGLLEASVRLGYSRRI